MTEDSALDESAFDLLVAVASGSIPLDQLAQDLAGPDRPPAESMMIAAFISHGASLLRTLATATGQTVAEAAENYRVADTLARHELELRRDEDDG